MQSMRVVQRATEAVVPKPKRGRPRIHPLPKEPKPVRWWTPSFRSQDQGVDPPPSCTTPPSAWSVCPMARTCRCRPMPLAGAAGMDLVAAVAERRGDLGPGARAVDPDGAWPIALPPGHELQLRPRSGLALRHGITLPNSPATIDEDYRGELQVILMNAGQEPVTIERGMRIAQAVLAPVTRAVWSEVAALDETGRGAGGFGSTGTAQR